MKPNMLKLIFIAVLILVSLAGFFYIGNNLEVFQNLSVFEKKKEIQEPLKDNPNQNWFKFAEQAKTESDCEQIPSSQEAKLNCYLQVAETQQNISLCDKSGKWRNLCRSRLSEFNISYPESEAEAIISQRAAEVILAIKNKDFAKLSEFAHPQKGVRFSPYSFVNDNDMEDLIFPAEEIKKGFNNNQEYLWGVSDGTGSPIKLTFGRYFKSFVYSHDFAKAEEVAYNRIIGRGNTLNNVFDAYPGGIVVEYYFSGFKPEFDGMDWESLRLVFEKYEDVWYLVGIIHDGWTI